MSDRILGLDIGPDGLKAVQVVAALNGRYRITAMACYAYETDDGPVDAIRKLRADEQMKSDFCIASLPVSAVSFRRLQMPFRDRKKIRQTIDFELEPLLPYAIADVATDFVVTGTAPPSAGTDLLAAAVPRAALEQTFERLAPFKVPLIDVEAVPMALQMIAAGYDDGSYLLLDVGGRQTVAVFIKAGRIFQVRGFAFGGDMLTEALSGTLDGDREKAEQEKRAGRLGEGWNRVAPVCEVFFAELNTTLQYLHMRREEEKPLKIVVTGGGALCSYFTDRLSEYFSIAVERLDIRAMRRVSFRPEMTDHWRPMLMNNALALALRGVRKDGGFNFRRQAGDFSLFKGKLKQIAAVALIVGGILLIDAAAGLFLDYRRSANLKLEIAHLLKTSVPGTTRVVDPVQQLRTRLNEARQYAQPEANGGGALALLKDLSATVPIGTDLVVTNLIYDGDRVELRAQTDTFDAVEQVKQQLGRSGFFKQITVNGATQVPSKNRVEFEMRMICAK